MASGERRRPEKPGGTTRRPVSKPIPPAATVEAADSVSHAVGRDESSFLGFSTTDLAGLTADDLYENKTGITMILHYYQQLTDDNKSLRTEVESLRTYQTGYQRAKMFGAIATVLTGLSNLFIGFGSSLVTGGEPDTGWKVFVPGLGLLIAGFGFLIWDSVRGQ